MDFKLIYVVAEAEWSVEGTSRGLQQCHYVVGKVDGGVEDACVSLPTRRKESNICPVSNTTLDSCGTELLVRRKLTFSSLYELNLEFALVLVGFFSPSCYRVQYFISPEITFSSFSPWCDVFKVPLKMNRPSSP